MAKGAVFAAVAACIGNFLQGWDNASIAGALLYIKKEFQLETDPTMEGLIVAMSLIAATAITTFSGTISDMYGRRYMLRISAILYFVSGLIMLWSPNVYVLLLGRALDGFGVGLAVTIVPLYISEISPPEIRGQLNTLPQLGGSGAMFLSYCVVFGMSLTESPSWRLMLGILSLISLLYVGLSIFYLPESPRWLVSKRRMVEATQVLQRLRGTKDVSGELALLVEGLASGDVPTLEEYMVDPVNYTIDEEESPNDNDYITIYDAQHGQSWIAKPINRHGTHNLSSRQGSIMSRGASLVDPLVTLFGSIHEMLPAETGGMRSMLFSNMGSAFNAAETAEKVEKWDEEAGLDYYASDNAGDDSDGGLKNPLLLNDRSIAEKDHPQYPYTGHALGLRRNSSLVQGNASESVTDIGGGWHMAYKYEDEKKNGVRRIYFQNDSHLASKRGSILSINTEGIPQPNSCPKVAIQKPQDNVNIQPVDAATQGPTWSDLCEPGVRHALFVGMGLLMLQQFCGINGILYYTPQLLEQAGVAQLLANTGMSSTSASILMSTLTMLVMLPCIVVAMRLMDVAGRRSLMLNTIPILVLVLVALIFSKTVDIGFIASATISTAGVVLYLSFFVMGLGPIPSIFYSEIFPTKVRGLCMAICALTYWIFNMVVTYTLPLLLSSLGLVGVFTIYAVFCIITWVFVYIKVPETKGMPLEVITEIFAAGSKLAAEKN